MKKKPDDNKWRTKYVDHSDRCWWWLASLFMGAMLAMIATACSEEVPGGQRETEEGLPATLRIDVSAHEPAAMQTRAVDTETIADLHILVYNSVGELIGHKYAENLTTTPCSVTVSTRSAENCTVYAIANTADATLFTGKAMTEALLEAMTTPQLTTWDELTNGTHLLMTGKQTGVSIAPGSPAGNKISGLSVSRGVAQVTLNIDVEPESGIIITDYQLYDLPVLSYYIARPMLNEAETLPGTNTDSDTSDGGEDAVNPATAEHWMNSGPITLPSASTTMNVTLYMYENRRGVNTNIMVQKDKIKTNAPLSATYIELRGKIGYYDVMWRIYLGANNTNNFNMKRNSCYTYNVILKQNEADLRVDVNGNYDGNPSNCYMILPGHGVTIPVIRANESFIKIDNYPMIEEKCIQLDYDTPWTASLIWQCPNNLIEIPSESDSGSGPNGRFTILSKDPTISGNAVVAIKNREGDILWSWHIWVTSYDGRTTFFTNNGRRDLLFMDRALGALSIIPNDIKACGLYYQWGRKDPFPGPAQEYDKEYSDPWAILTQEDPIVVYNSSGFQTHISEEGIVRNNNSNNLTNAIQNPTKLYVSSYSSLGDWFIYSSSASQNPNLWGGGNIALGKAAAKTVYDPCPDGWRIAPWLDSTSPFLGMKVMTFKNHGGNWSGIGGYMPAGGHRYANPGFDAVGKTAYYWSASPQSTYAYNLAFLSDNTVKPTYSNNRGLCCPVRCLKDNI